jgi:hypothetical protein
MENRSWPAALALPAALVLSLSAPTASRAGTDTWQKPAQVSTLPAPQPPVAKFETAEITLRAAQTYNGSAGTPNPFLDVPLVATVVAPSGATYVVDGFFDGNGAGGQSGDVFKVRIFLDEQGTWTWTTISSDSGLHGKSGTVRCKGTLPGVFGQGPLEIDPQHPRHFAFRDGPPVYLIGKYLDEAMPHPLRYSQTFFSEEITDQHRQAMLDRHVAMKANKLNVYVANGGDYGGISTTPWLGEDWPHDQRRFHLARWRDYDRWISKLRDAGMVAHLWFFADDSSFTLLPASDRQHLVRYAMARLSGYVHTMFVLTLEWQEEWTALEVIEGIAMIDAHNPWRRYVSVHGVEGNCAFANEAWSDYLDLQSGNWAAHPQIHSLGLSNRALALKPLLNEEFGLGQEDTALRQKTWAAFTAGAAGSGTGAYLAPLADFVQTVPFSEMQPADGLVTAGAAYALAQPGAVYVAYLYDGGTITLNLSGASGTLAVSWFDPRDGSTVPGGSVQGGAGRVFTAPTSEDWVLRVAVPD